MADRRAVPETTDVTTSLWEFRRPVAPEWLVWWMFGLLIVGLLFIVAAVSYVAIGEWRATTIASQIACSLFGLDCFLLIVTRPR